MREVFQLLPDEEIRDIAVRQQIEKGAITAESFSALPAEEQQRVLRVLFDTYAERISVPRSLCGLEYLLFALAKLFFRHVVMTDLTPEEQAFVDRLRSIVDAHEVTLTGSVNEYLDYIETGASITRQNRDEYREKKAGITG